MTENELYHYGVLGMKWGIRRYQNKDGTLTKAGVKRYNKEMSKVKEQQRIVNNKKRTQAKIDKLNEAKRKLKEDEESLKTKKDENQNKSKSSSSTSSNPSSNQQSQNTFVNQNPKAESKGKTFMNVVLKEMAAPAAKDVGKQIFKSGFTAAANEKVIKRFATKYGLDPEPLLVFTNNKKK